MKYCMNCGKQLPDDAKFCVSCGMQVKTETPPQSQNKRKVEQGTLYKCPNCGEALASLTDVCPACGYEVRNTKSSDAISEFSEKFADLDTNAQKIDLIRNYPIPNTREDIFDFLILTSSNLSAATSDTVINDSDDAVLQMELAKAWYAKLHQCYQKAALLLHDDADFARVQQLCDQANSDYQNAYGKYQVEFSRAAKREEKEQRKINRWAARTHSQPYAVRQSASKVLKVWKNKWVAFLLCLFLGWAGGHKFYEGKVGEGILYLLTIGLFGFGWGIDCIILLNKHNPYYVILKH